MTFLGLPLETAAAVAEWALIVGGIVVAGLAGLVTHLNHRVKIVEKLATDRAIAAADARAAEANAEAAKARLETAEINERFAPRVIDPVVRSKLVEALKMAPDKGPIKLGVVPSDSEAYRYATQIADVLIESGWSSSRGLDNHIFAGNLITGITLVINAPDNAPGFLEPLLNAFRTSGLDVTIATSRHIRKGSFAFVVGHKDP